MNFLTIITINLVCSKAWGAHILYLTQVSPLAESNNGLSCKMSASDSIAQSTGISITILVAVQPAVSDTRS